MSIFRKFTEFHKFNLLHMSSVDMDILLKLPELRQSQNWGIFLQKTYTNNQAGCESWLPAYRLAWFPPDLRFVKAGTESRLSGNDCRNLGKNAKCKNELEQWLGTVCRV